jgi:hypothetical protein
LSDDTAGIRKEMIESGQPAVDLAADDGPTWDTEALKAEFEVLGFSAPFVVVRRRPTGRSAPWSSPATRGCTSAGRPTDGP